MDKQNDMILNILANPSFEVRDFLSVGLKGDNTNLRSEEEYLQSDKITKNPAFLDDNGQFDKGKFHDFYTGAAVMYNELAQDDYRLTVLDDARFSEDNIWVEPKQRTVSYAPKLVREPNEHLVTSSLDGVGKKGQRTRSVSEIAQTQQVYNTETGQWEDSPNDSFFGHFTDTLVLATYDEDVFDDDGKKIHSKGERKLNDEGLPYYETLGGRNPHEKLVLNKLNVLTRDGSFANKFDFFDEDDINQKSIGGTILRNAALVGSMFIPYVGPAVIATSVLTQSVGLAATLGKVLTGSDSPTLNNMLGWAKSMNRQALTEYAAENTWCVENFLNMIGDTVGQLAEQRWIFKAAPALMQGSLKPYKAMSTKGREKLIAETAEQMEKSGTGLSMEKLMEHVRTTGDISKLQNLNMQAQRMADINRSLAVSKVDALIDKSTKMGSPLAKAYMTGITVQDTYDEAKAAGASDLEAAFLTIGYAAAEAKLLNSELGEWVMPELHGNKFRSKAVAQAMVQDIKKAMNVASKESATSRTGLAKSIIDKGKKWFNHEYSEQLYRGGKSLNVVAAHALGESFEEVSEEALADFSKSVFNATRWLRGEDALDMGQWDNMADRYAMSALGGFIGGGLNSAATDFTTARNLNNMSRTQALQELIYMVNNGTENDFLKEVDKMNLGNKNLSANELVHQHRNEDGTVDTVNAEAKNVEDSQDYQIKQMVKNQVNMIKSLLESEGARVSTDSLISLLTLENQDKVMKDLRLSGLKNATTLGLYLQDFQTLQEDIIKTKAEILRLESSRPDSGEDPQSLKDQLLKLNQKLLQLRTAKDAFLSGKVSAQFVRDALFEMNPVLSNFAIKASEANFLETIYGKKVADLSDSELEQGRKKYEEYSKTNMKNDIHTQAQLFGGMLANASPVVQQQHQYAQQVLQLSQGLVQAQNYLQRVLGSMDSLSSTADVDSTLGEASSILTTLDMNTTYLAAIPYLSDDVKQHLTDLLNQSNTVIDGETPQQTEQRKQQLFQDYKTTLYDGLAANINDIMAPIVKESFLNPEIKHSLVKTVDKLFQYYQGRYAALFPVAQNARMAGDPNAQVLLDKLSEVEKYRDDLKTNLDLLKTKSNTPILEFLSQYQKNATNSDVDLMEHWKKTMGIFADASSFTGQGLTDNQTDASEIITSDEWVEDNKEVQQLLDSFEAVITGMRVDNGDFDNPTGYTRMLNQINARTGNTDAEQLAEIDAGFADMVLQDVHMLQKRFKVAEELSALNRGQKLKQQEKVATRKNFLLYKNLSHLSDVVPPDDWDTESLAKLKATIDAADFLSTNYERDTLQFTKEEKMKAEEEMLNIEDAIFDFFEANKVDGKLDSKKVGRLLYALAGDAGFFAENDELLTENSKSIDHNSFIWWLASRAALKGSDFYGAYRKSLGDDRAPIASLELATYLGVAAYTNMDMLNSFVDAYRDTVITEFNKKDPAKRKELLKETADGGYATDLLKYFGGHDVIPQYRNMIFIEGAPGTGKSKGVFNNIKKIIADIDPSIADKAWYIHATDESAKEAATDLGLNGLAMGREKFLDKLSTGHKTAVEQEDEITDVKGNKTKVKRLHLVNGTYSFNNEGQLVNTEKLNNFSTDELPKVIFIDEISHYNEQELSLIEQFARKNGIVVMTAGDLQQNTQEAYATLPGVTDAVSVSISRNKFIRTPKLGVSLRSRNKTIEDAMAAMQVAFKMTKEKGHEISFQYTDNDLNHPGLFGVKVIQSTSETDVSDDKIEDAKKTVDLMMSTLKDGQKVGYIWDGTHKSKLYDYVDSKYHDKVDFKKGSDAQGLEGQYYIVENDRSTSTSMDRNTEYLRSLYTGISRAEQGVLVIANGSGTIGNVTGVSSTKAKELQLLDLGEQAIKRASEVRKQQLDYILDGRTVNTLQIKNPTPYTPTTPIATPTATPTPHPLPPVLPPVATTPRRIGKGWTNRDELQAIVDRLQSRITPDTKVKDNTDQEFTIKGLGIREDTISSTPVFIPAFTLEDSAGAEVTVDLEDFKTNYTLFTPTSVIPIYNVGDTMSITNGAGTENVQITALDVTDPNNPVYTIKNLSDNSERTISQNELLAIYQGVYNPPATPSQTETPTTGLENAQGSEYEEAVTAANVEEEPERVHDGHIDHVLYTFHGFGTGMERDANGKAVFKDINDPKIKAKFDARIDNMVGLTKLLGTDNYDKMDSLLGAIRNIIMNTEDKSLLADKVRKLVNAQVADPTNTALGMKGNVGVSFAIKSVGKRTNGNGKYDRFDVGDEEELEYIHSDDPQRAKQPLNKNLVAIFDVDGDNKLEISLGYLNSPLTLWNTPDGQGGFVYQDVHDDFAQYLANGDNYYDATSKIIAKYQNKYPELMDLARLWLYTSNGIFYLDDDFTVAKYASNGPELSKRKGQKQWDGRLGFDGRFISIEEFAKHPQHHVSSVMMATDDSINGQKVPGLHAGHSFVLVSDNDDYRAGGDKALADRYIAQILNPSLKKDVKLFYVVPPSASVGDWLRNIHNLYTNQLSESSPYRTTNQVFDIGNDFTAYRVLEAMIDNGTYDGFNSSQDTKDEVKQAIQDLKDIEGKWNEETLNLDHSKLIEGRPEDEYFQWFKDNGFDEKEARNYMKIREQRQYLNSKNGWGKASVTADRTIAQALSGYLTNIVWERRPDGSMVTDPNLINSRLKAIEDAVKGKVDKVYYKAQYSDDTVSGNFVRVKTNGKWKLGQTPSGTDANFQINAKIDTPTFLLTDISGAIHNIVQNIFYDPARKVWDSQIGYKKANEDRYLVKARNNQTLGLKVASKYSRYTDYLDPDILADDTITSEHDMIVALANKFNEEPGRYGFVHNDRLYLTVTGIKLNNPNAEISSSDDVITFTDAVDLATNEPVEIAINFIVNPADSTISQVESRTTRFRSINISQGSQLLIDDAALATFQQEFQQWKDGPGKRMVTSFNPDFSSTENFKTSVMNWMMNSASAKRAILSIRKGLERENASQSSIDLLQSLLDYDGTVTQINLQPDDIVRSDTARYLINDVLGTVVTATHVDDNNQPVTEPDGQPAQPAVIDVTNMQKEETECAPTLWNLI